MLTRILELADPVATCADDRLRFEAFSACCSVYGRVDLLPDAYDGETLGRGTTNVDFGPGIRSALAGVQDRSRLGPVGRSGRGRGRGRRRVGGRADASRCRRAGCAGSSRSRRSRPSWRRRPSSMPPGRERSSGRSRSRRRSGRSGSPRPARACGSFHHDPGQRRRRPRRPRPASPVRAGRPPRDGAAASSPWPATAAPAGSSTFRAPG